MNTPKEIIQQWLHFTNARNAGELAKLYHERATYIQLATGNPLSGRRTIFEEFFNFFENVPDFHMKIENLLEDGPWAIQEWSAIGTFKPTGRKYILSGANFFHIQEGKILVHRGYWDKATWFEQIGIPI